MTESFTKSYLAVDHGVMGLWCWGRTIPEAMADYMNRAGRWKKILVYEFSRDANDLGDDRLKLAQWFWGPGKWRTDGKHPTPESMGFKIVSWAKNVSGREMRIPPDERFNDGVLEENAELVKHIIRVMALRTTAEENAVLGRILLEAYREEQAAITDELLERQILSEGFNLS